MTTRCAGLFVLLSLAGCDRINSLLGKDSPAPAASGSAGAGAAGAAPSAEVKGDDPLAMLAGFEGEIDITAKGKTSPAPVNLSLLVKNEVVRIDAPPDLLASPQAQSFLGPGKVYALLKAAEKKVIVVLDGKQQAIVIDLDQAADQAKSFRQHGAGGPGAGASPAADPPKVVKTGKTETIAGYSCEDWDVLSSDKSKLSLCVANKGASWFHLPLTGIPTEQAWALELLDGKHFPMRGIASEKDGSEAGRVEVTKLDKRTLDAAQFEVPTAYKQVTLTDMLAGLGGVPPADVPTPQKSPHHGGHHHGKH